ncbi:MAG: 16S rRNA (adenine(1518)-N(6)/adenine(1519)-N(6))-dimethyltransferase, partial [Legionellales bacterium]
MKHSPRKRFGQNFLIDDIVVGNLVKSLGLQSDKDVLEIGPGKGAITELILPKCKHLTVVEIDRDLATLLSKRFGDKNNFTLYTQDILKTNLQDIVTPDANLKIVGNLPYNVATQILLLFNEYQHTHKDSVSAMYFMLQKEV